MLITIKDYCNQRGVSSQFVYNYIRKGKFKAIDLPTFVRYEGVEHFVGSQKFIEVSENIENEAYAKAVAKRASSDLEIRKAIFHLMKLDEKEASHYKVQLKEIYNENHPKYSLIQKAFQVLHDILLEEMNDMESLMNDLETA